MLIYILDLRHFRRVVSETGMYDYQSRTSADGVYRKVKDRSLVQLQSIGTRDIIDFAARLYLGVGHVLYKGWS